MKNFTKIEDFKYRCNYCNQEVHSGMVNISNHIINCEKYPRSEISSKLTMKDLKDFINEIYYNKSGCLSGPKE